MTLTFSHLSADSFEAHLKAGRKRPRVREAVSCWQCRMRKTRCDREAPCGQCKHRGLAQDCVYSTPKDRQPAPRSRSGATKKTPAPTPPQQQHFLEMQTHTPPDSCSSRGETPEPASASIPTPTSLQTPRITRSEKLNALSRSTSRGGTAFRGSAFKTRMIGLSHWMAPCNEMIVLKAMLDHSAEFHASRKAFAELKVQLRLQNTIPAPQLGVGCAALRLLLPERRDCDDWLAKYLRSYGRIYGILDEPAFMRDYERIHAGTLDHPIHLSKVLLAVAIAMQASEPDRLEGRRLARAVEDCIHTSKFQKPCVGVVQVLLLLLVIKTISASDTDKIYDVLALHGLTSQIVSSMGLQRDPTLFVEVTPYYAELRKRLWACFVRLNLEYCIRSGTQFNLRLDESDCPLPLEISLRTLDEESDDTTDVMKERQEATDVTFAIAAAKLAKIMAPLHQALYSPNPPSSAELQKDLRTGFGDFLSALPPALKPGAKPFDPIEEMQRCLISIPMTSFLSISSLGSTLSTPTDASQRSQLMDLWDNAASVLSQFQRLCEFNPETSNMACHLLWTDAARSALTSCWILGRLRQLDNSRIISYPQQTVSMYREVLTKSLTFLSELWQARYHSGAVAAKLNLLLAVSLNVTANLYTDDVDPATFRQKLFTDASATAETLIAGMRYDLQQRQQPLVSTTLATMHNLSSLSPADGFGPTWSPGNTDLLGIREPLSSVSTPLMGHDFLAIDFPSDNTFSSLYPEYGFPVLGDGMFQGGTSLPTFDEQTMVSMW